MENHDADQARHRDLPGKLSFDHYFATYPHATNPQGEPAFYAKGDTPRVNNLLSGGLLDENPNSTQPFRMDTGVASVTCDQNHSYTPEQEAVDHGLMDKYPESTGSGFVLVVALQRLRQGHRRGDGLFRRQHDDGASGITRSTSP